VAADEELAAIAIDEALGEGGDDRRIARARQELGRAAEAVRDGRFESAIDHYAAAWQEADRALDARGPGGHGGEHCSGRCGSDDD
jgi:hypothetical protein